MGSLTLHKIAVDGTLRCWSSLLSLYQNAGVHEPFKADENDAVETHSEISGRVNLEADG
jgi:hypothetical protein